MIKILTTGGPPCAPYINKCLQSFVDQTYEDWEMCVVLDQVYPDGTYDTRMHIEVNSKQMFSTKNLLNAMSWYRVFNDIDDDDIIVTMDADDWLYDRYALEKVVACYDENPDLLVTHGSWVREPANERVGLGKGVNMPYTKKEFRNLRYAPWKGSQLRTMKYKVFKRIRDDSFRDSNGEYFKTGCDVAMMWAAMEMAGFDRVKHIPDPLYVYNRAYTDEEPDAEKRKGNIEVRKEGMKVAKYIQQRKPYERVDF